MNSVEYLKNLLSKSKETSNKSIKRIVSIEDVIDMNTYVLNQNEIILIEEIREAFFFARKNIELDSNFKTKLSKLNEREGNENISILSNKPLIKSVLANFLVQPFNRVILFAKQLSDFTQLDLDDQLSLIREGSMEVSICSASQLYDSLRNQLLNKIATDTNPSDDNNNQSFISLEQMSALWGRELFEKTIKYFKSMNDIIGQDESARILYLLLILFSPDRHSLKNTNIISHLHSKYAFLVKKYLYSKYGLKEGEKLNTGLLEMFDKLETLQDLHKSFLKDSDQTIIDPLPKAIIFD